MQESVLALVGISGRFGSESVAAFPSESLAAFIGMRKYTYYRDIRYVFELGLSLEPLVS